MNFLISLALLLLFASPSFAQRLIPANSWDGNECVRPGGNVESMAYDTKRHQIIVANDDTTAFLAMTDGCVQVGTNVTQSDLLVVAQVVAPGATVATHVDQTEILAFDEANDLMWLLNIPNSTSACSGDVGIDIVVLYKMERNAADTTWQAASAQILPKGNECPAAADQIFQYQDMIAVDGTIYFGNNDIVAGGLYEFNLERNTFVNLDVPTLPHPYSDLVVGLFEMTYDHVSGLVFLSSFPISTDLQLNIGSWKQKRYVNEFYFATLDYPGLTAARGFAAMTANGRYVVGNNGAGTNVFFVDVETCPSGCPSATLP